MIAVAHRLSTARHARLVITMHRGAVVDAGRRVCPVMWGHTTGMTEAVVEGDSGRMDARDMTAVLAVLDGIAVSAEATGADAPGHDDAWTLCVHWLQHGPVSSDTQAALPDALTAIQSHFAGRAKTPPARIELRGPDHGLLLAVPDDSPEH